MIKEAPQLDKSLPSRKVGQFGVIFWQDFFVFGLYGLITVGLTFPLIFQLSTNLRGGASTSGDVYQNIWYMWWYGRALEQGLDPTHSNLMYGLLPNVQVLISSILNGLIMWPVVKLFGALTAYNLAVLLSFPLAGYFAYKLADEVMQGGSKIAAFATGFFFTFSTYHFYRAEGHLGLVTLQWLPFYVWRLLVLKRQPGWLNAAWVAVGLALAALSDLYYLGYFVLPVTAFFVIWYGLTERRTFWQWRNLRYIGAGLLVGLLLIAPFYSFFLNLDADVRQSVGDRSNDVRNFSADLLAFVLPTAQNPVFGNAIAPIYANFKSLFPIEQAVFPGYLLILLAASSLFAKQLRKNLRLYFWLALAGVALVFALGPRLHINGQEVGPAILPYGWIYGKLPLLGNFRAPNRFGVVVVLALAVTAGLALSYWLNKIKWPQVGQWRKAVPALTVGLILALSLAETLTFAVPFKTDVVTIGAVYRQIASEPGDFLVLELPLGTQSRPLYDQITHGKRLVGGVATRISNRMTLSWDKAGYLGMFNPAESSAVINNGQALAAPGGPDIFPLDISFRQMLDEQNIGYVTLRTNRPAFAWMKDYLIKELGQPTSQEVLDGEPLLAWRLLPVAQTSTPVQPGNYRIRLGDGWNAGLGKSTSGRLLRLVEQDGQLLITPATSGPAQLTLTVTPYIRPQKIEVRLNGSPISYIEGSTPWQPFTASINLTLGPGQNVVELHSTQGCLHPIDYIPNSPDLRCISFAVEGVQMKDER